MNPCHGQQPIDRAGTDQNIVINKPHVVALLRRRQSLPGLFHQMAFALGRHADHIKTLGVTARLKTFPGPVEQNNWAQQRLIKHNAMAAALGGNHHQIIGRCPWIHHRLALLNGVLPVELLHSRSHLRQELIAMAAQHPAGPLLAFGIRTPLQQGRERLRHAACQGPNCCCANSRKAQSAA